eukprot:CAMPEP_0168525166 /NCGR_PEP_ID=MMETSP0405-20121227/11131_1 /TAXON_ID=498012 /ORGANISM="Trichosphaerium sp, Strain Am-I-7 wt" /LENGTH=378 /DNA_ID=CAMNT_0008547607 /DNA_START=163 /DNA_END=1299 /DNA_ORIENTATION=-
MSASPHMNWKGHHEQPGSDVPTHNVDDYFQLDANEPLVKPNDRNQLAATQDMMDINDGHHQGWDHGHAAWDHANKAHAPHAYAGAPPNMYAGIEKQPRHLGNIPNLLDCFSKCELEGLPGDVLVDRQNPDAFLNGESHKVLQTLVANELPMDDQDETVAHFIDHMCDLMMFGAHEQLKLNNMIEQFCENYVNKLSQVHKTPQQMQTDRVMYERAAQERAWMAAGKPPPSWGAKPVPHDMPVHSGRVNKNSGRRGDTKAAPPSSGKLQNWMKSQPYNVRNPPAANYNNETTRGRRRVLQPIIDDNKPPIADSKTSSDGKREQKKQAQSASNKQKSKGDGKSRPARAARQKATQTRGASAKDKPRSTRPRRNSTRNTRQR